MDTRHGKPMEGCTNSRQRFLVPTLAQSSAPKPGQTVLVCRLASKSEWETTLVEALNSPGLPFDVHFHAATESDVERLTPLVQRLAPGLIFLSFPAAATSQAGSALARIQAADSCPPIIGVTDLLSTGHLPRLFDMGLVDYVLSPLRPEDVLCRARRWLGALSDQRRAADALKREFGLKELVGSSPGWLEQLNKLPRFAQADACVLIYGETGTGKELCARALHHFSRHSGGPFVPLNTGAIPAELVENELFGHESGAYTGARAPQRGLIAEAEGGTLFLDEVDSLPLAAQVKLLRFLQDHEYRPLGASRTNRANIRILAACNGDLGAAVIAGRFRKDLFYRLNVLPLSLPPLRERREDIAPLSEHFVSKHGSSLGGPAILTADAVAKLRRHDWPGNVRELENVIERALVLRTSPVITSRDIDLPVPDSADAHPPDEESGPETFRSAKARMVGEFERDYLRQMLQRSRGNISEAARASGKHRRAFFELMRKHKIKVSLEIAPGNTGNSSSIIPGTIGGKPGVAGRGSA